MSPNGDNNYDLNSNPNSKRPCVTTCRPAAKKSIPRDWQFISPWIWSCVNSEIKLLPKILPCPVLRPNVPHSHVVQSHVNSSPRLGIYLFSIKQLNKLWICLNKLHSASSNLCHIHRTWVVQRATASLKLYPALLEGVHCPPSILLISSPVNSFTMEKMTCSLSYNFIRIDKLTQQQRTSGHLCAMTEQCPPSFGK